MELRKTQENYYVKLTRHHFLNCGINSLTLLVEASVKYAGIRNRENGEYFWKKVYLQLVAEVHEAIGSDPLEGTKPALESIRELRSKSI